MIAACRIGAALTLIVTAEDRSSRPFDRAIEANRARATTALASKARENA